MSTENKNEELNEKEVVTESEKHTDSEKKECRKDKRKDKCAELEKQVSDLNEKIAKEKDDSVRLMAEFDNYRRRTAQEKLELVNTASEGTIKGLLPILDDFERAMKALEESSDSEAAKEGTTLIYNKLMGYLRTKGLNAIEAAGKEFDTDLHEAVAQFPVEDEEKKGKVFDVAQTGYTLNGKVIRFAKVVVGI